MDIVAYSAAVADQIHTAAKAAGYSVLSLSAETGIPRSTLERRFNSDGLSPFTTSEVKAIAQVLGTRASALLTVYVERVPA